MSALILDLDNTLYSYDRAHRAGMDALAQYAWQHFSLGRSDFEVVYRQAKQKVKGLVAGTAAEHNRLLYCQRLSEQIGVGPVGHALPMSQCYWDAFLSEARLYEGALAVMEYCRTQRIPVAICTDMTADIQHRKLTHFGLVPFLDALVTSEETGREKPDASMFRLVLEKINVSADQAMFVGDDLEKDVRGARRCGLRAHWFRPDKQRGNAQTEPEPLYTKLCDIIPLLERIP